MNVYPILTFATDEIEEEFIEMQCAIVVECLVDMVENPCPFLWYKEPHENLRRYKKFVKRNVPIVPMVEENAGRRFRYAKFGTFYPVRQMEKELKFVELASMDMMHRDQGMGYYEGYVLQRAGLKRKLKRHGFGVYTSSTETYAGEWKHDRKHGYGIWVNRSFFMHGSEKMVYIGQFVEDLKHGYGLEVVVNGDDDLEVYAGLFWKGYRHGLGSLWGDLGYREGWFRSSTFVHAVLSLECRSNIPFEKTALMPQPARGMNGLARYLALVLDYKCRHVFNVWRGALLKAVRKGVGECFELATEAYGVANEAEYNAYRLDMEIYEKEIRRRHIEAGPLLNLRTQLDEDVNRRAILQKDLNSCEKNREQSDTLQTIQEQSMVHLTQKEAELDEAVEMAKMIQSECGNLDKHIVHLHREIEVAQVELNQLKLQSPKLFRTNKVVREHAQRRKNITEEKVPILNEKDMNICSVPNCNCGISKTAFLSIGRALNDE